jgi:hypothetical protein
MIKNGWDRVDERVNKGPMSLWGLIVVGLIVMGVTFFFLGLFGEAVRVAQDEFGPKAGLQKYSWFIDQANAIEKMDRDLAIFEGRTKAVSEQYKGYGSDMAKWPPHIQMQYNKDVGAARDDLAALASLRNNLVREYNAASQKFNWSPFLTRPDKPREEFPAYIVP